LWGDEDDVTPIDQSVAAQELLQPRLFHVITGCGHMAPFERPRDVADRIALFTAAHVGRLNP
jgi:pimeloyl-ACP methyl ester carboxylesterase